MLDESLGVLGRHVLPESAAQGHVQNLHAPADAKDGLSHFQAGLDEPDFKDIPFFIGGSDAPQRFFSVEARRRIGAAGNHQGVKGFHKLLGIRIVVISQNHRQNACLSQGI